ncbi:MAG: hypothetical protein JSU90_05660 [Nitrospiraceae bacterium]|nr:MAG: hypothetical protein JSU90_05660 [Nitrospiraceae bacterium]
MEIPSGTVINYYRALGVASIKVTSALEVGSRIHIKGHTTDFDQTVESLQIQKQGVHRATAGEIVGLKVKDFVRKNDRVYRVEE